MNSNFFIAYIIVALGGNLIFLVLTIVAIVLAATVKKGVLWGFILYTIGAVFQILSLLGQAKRLRYYWSSTGETQLKYSIILFVLIAVTGFVFLLIEKRKREYKGEKNCNSVPSDSRSSRKLNDKSVEYVCKRCGATLYYYSNQCIYCNAYSTIIRKDCLGGFASTVNDLQRIKDNSEKRKTVYECSICKKLHREYSKTCPCCRAMNTLVKETIEVESDEAFEALVYHPAAKTQVNATEQEVSSPITAKQCVVDNSRAGQTDNTKQANEERTIPPQNGNGQQRLCSEEEDEGKRFCNYCGAELASGSKFCGKCGRKAKVETTMDSPKDKAATAREKPFDIDISKLPPKLQRAFLFIEDSEWARAEEYLEEFLDSEPLNPYAYLGKVMLEFRLNDMSELHKVSKELETSKEFKKARRFADEELGERLKELVP